MNANRLKGEIVAIFGTQMAFSKAMGWGENKVSNMLTGKYTPNIEEAARMAELLNLDTLKYVEIFLPDSAPNGDKSYARQTNTV